MKRGLQRSGASAGFTIVETMIVLAVTGILFVTIAVTWSGRQHKSEFTAATQEVRSRLQQTIGDVQSGYFPSSEAFGCVQSGNGIKFTTATVKQGQNADCIFLGKAVQFRMGTTDPEEYRIYSITGLRNPSDITDITTASPTALAPDGTGGTSAIADLSSVGKQMFGLTTVAMKVNDHGTMRDIGAVGFFSRMGSIDNYGGLSNGMQQVDLYAIKTNRVNSYDSMGAANAINYNLQHGNFVVNQPVSICLKSGATNQYGLVKLGADSRELSAELKVMTTVNCGL